MPFGSPVIIYRMNFDLGWSWADGSGENPPDALQVVVAYEDFLMGRHALETLDRLLPPGGQGRAYGTHNVWKFDLLETGRFCDVAVEGAANADMVFISAHGSGDLPPGVRRWMERWIKRRERDAGALVLLMDGNGASKTKRLLTEGHLKEYALRSGMDFFVQTVFQDRTADPPDLPSNLTSMPQSFELLNEMMRTREGFRGWNLND